MIDITKINIEMIHEFENELDKGILEQLGVFSWKERVHFLEIKNNIVYIKFYSDNLNLSIKSNIELFIRNKLNCNSNNLTVYFEKKELSKKNISNNNESKSIDSNPENTATHSTSKKRPIKGVKRIIAVASGKGGVGKSTVSVNLALSLHNQGYKVGILDADIYGPSVPTMLDIHKDPLINESNKIIPPEAYGIKVMSFGFFAPEETAVIWRGPMIMKALQQFFWDVEWGELDFLIIDLPPGTGDAQLTLVQSIPISGAVIVTTPQNVALLDAVKGIAMFRKTSVPILGIIENMSTFSCPSCGTESHIFGFGGAERVSGKFEIPLLGHIPLFSEIRESGDTGKPLTLKPNHHIRIRFADIAEKVVKNSILM